MLFQLSELGWKASPTPRAHPPRSSPAPGGLVGETGGVGKTHAGARRMAGKAEPARGGVYGHLPEPPAPAAGQAPAAASLFAQIPSLIDLIMEL